MVIRVDNCYEASKLHKTYTECTLQKVAAAKDYYQRKVDFLTQQMEKIQPLLQEKYQMKEGGCHVSIFIKCDVER